MTMSLGVGAVVAPVSIGDATLLHAPVVAMLVLLAIAILLALRNDALARPDSIVLFAGYPAFVILAAL
jgi:cation:H+ antiporter